MARACVGACPLGLGLFGHRPVGPGLLAQAYLCRRTGLFGPVLTRAQARPGEGPLGAGVRGAALIVAPLIAPNEILTSSLCSKSSGNAY